MNRFASGAALTALTLLASLPALPVSAQTPAVTLSVADVDPLPGQRVDVSGDGPDCPADASGAGSFSVTLTYTTPALATATVVVSGAVATNGTFTTSVTLPDTAVSEQPASIASSSTCSGIATPSNRVTLSVLYHTGVETLSAATVAAGGSVTVSGTNCYGGEYVILYGPAGQDPNDYTNGTSGAPAADRAFAATLTIPPTMAVGRYDVYALCRGTEYVEQQMTVTARAAAPAATTAPTAAATTVTTVAPAPAPSATWGGGFIGGGTAATGVGGSVTTTPVATAPVAVAAEAAFTG
ncbi:MAG: hypothetical protein ABIM89_08145 [Mycobacteriales bacterium]